jgi:hypothetical protein
MKKNAKQRRLQQKAQPVVVPEVQAEKKEEPKVEKKHRDVVWAEYSDRAKEALAKGNSEEAEEILEQYAKLVYNVDGSLIDPPVAALSSEEAWQKFTTFCKEHFEKDKDAIRAKWWARQELTSDDMWKGLAQDIQAVSKEPLPEIKDKPEYIPEDMKGKAYSEIVVDDLDKLMEDIKKQSNSECWKQWLPLVYRVDVVPDERGKAPLEGIHIDNDYPRTHCGTTVPISLSTGGILGKDNPFGQVSLGLPVEPRWTSGEAYVYKEAPENWMTKYIFPVIKFFMPKKMFKEFRFWVNRNWK